MEFRFLVGSAEGHTSMAPCLCEPRSLTSLRGRCSPRMEPLFQFLTVFIEDLMAVRVFCNMTSFVLVD
jgi:hypothetical protein